MSANLKLFFPVGSRAEVSSDEVGFRGSWYVVTVVDRRRNQALVKYDTLFEDENSDDLFSEWADVSYLRPLPPPDDDDNADFQAFEMVDGYTRDGWWTGEVIRVVENGEGKKKFVVFFDNVPEEIRFERAELRKSRKWVDGKWTFPKKVKRNNEDEYTFHNKWRKVQKQKEFEECERELKLTKSRTAQRARMNQNVNDPNLTSNMCHQCQRNDKGPVVRCTKCKRKRYCVCCMKCCPVNADESLKSSKSSHAGLEESYQDGGSGLKQEVSYYPPDEESNLGSSESELESLSEDGQAGYHSSLPDKKGVTDAVVLRLTSSLTEIHTPSSSSPVLSHRNPNSLPADTVRYFKQLEEMLLHNKFNHVLPPEIQLDEKTIKDNEQILKRGLAGQLRQLGKGTNYQEFNEVLTCLLACRSIPPCLYQGFLSLREDLPILANRAFELNKKVTDGMLARAKMVELEKYMETYHEFGDSLIKLEQERESNLSEILRLQARNEVIDAEITNFTDEAKELQKISASYSHNIESLKAMETIDEAAIQSSMDALCDLEFEWRNRVAMLEY